MLESMMTTRRPAVKLAAVMVAAAAAFSGLTLANAQTAAAGSNAAAVTPPPPPPADGGAWGPHGHRGPGFMGHGPMKGGPDHFIGRMLKQVGASDEQKQKVFAIFKQARQDAKPLMDRRRDDHMKSMDLLLAPSVDRAALENLRADSSQAADQTSKIFSKAMADAADVLTPDQRAKLKVQMDERRERMEQRHGHRPRP